MLNNFNFHFITCSTCSHEFQVSLLKGIHVSRHPEVRDQILDGSFQVFSCENCGVNTRIENTTVFTDFANSLYIAVEVSGQHDWQTVLYKHQNIFDHCFTMGPEVAKELSPGLRCRLVFGFPALKEKLLLLDSGLNDWVVEILKGQTIVEKGWSFQHDVLRLITILDGGHLLLGRLAATIVEEAPAGQLKQIPNYELRDHITIPSSRYKALLSNHSRQNQFDWLRQDWIVDIHSTAARS